MKSKTKFKQMYLVDETIYNKVKDTVSTSPPIILGKLSSENVPQTFNVSLSTPETT